MEGAQLPLVAAIRKNRGFAVIQKLAERGADVNRAERSTGCSPLLACVAGHTRELEGGEALLDLVWQLRVCNLLLNKGADVR